MKKVISCMICALLLVGCMAGCGSTGGKSGSGNGIKIMMSLSQGDDFRNTIVEQAKKTAQEKGATLDVYDEDGSLESQVEHIKQAAKEKYDVILCGPVNADTALELESLADGIPVIFYNSCPDASYLETGKYMYVGSDENVAGQYQAEYILDKIKGAKRPVFMIGHGANGETEKMLTDLARVHHIPMITSVLARSVLKFDDPLNFGCIGGAYGHRYANMIANAKSDLLLCFGISLCTRQIGTKVHEFAKGAEIVRVDIDPYNLQREIHEGRKGEKCFCVSAEDVACKLTEQQAQIGSYEEWLAVCRKIRKELEQVDDATPQRYPNRMIAYLSDQLSDTGAVAVDVGQHMVWSYQSFHNQQGQKTLFSGGHGAMGYALPAAIGAYYATGKPVACICGDGAFQMNIQELQWEKRENIPVKMIVMNNEALGMIRHLQRDYFDCVYADTSDGSGFSSCNFSDVAQAYKIPAKRIQGEDVEKYAGKFLEQSGPELLEIMLEHGTYAYPKTCLGEPIHNQQPYIPKPIFDELMEL